MEVRAGGHPHSWKSASPAHSAPIMSEHGCFSEQVLSYPMQWIFIFTIFTEIGKSGISFLFAWKIALHSELYQEEKNRGGILFLLNLIYPQISVLRTIVRE